MQMTGRVRRLESATVRVCAPRGIIQAAPSHRHVTALEARTFLLWRSMQLQWLPVISRRAANFYREGDPPFKLCQIPDDGLPLTIMAHNEAAAANSNLRFFAELQVRRGGGRGATPMRGGGAR